DALSLPAKLQFNPGEPVHLYPFAPAVDAQLLLFQSDSADTIGASIEMRSGDEWRTIGSRTGHSVRLEVPLSQPISNYRLRLWSVDQRGIAVSAQIASTTMPIATEKELATGVASTAVPDMSSPIRIAGATLLTPGMFRVPGALRICAKLDAPCEAPVR